MANKLPWHLNDVVDTVFVNISDKIEPWLFVAGITPNHVTLSSFGFLGWFFWCIWTSQFKLAAALLVFIYFTDCLDGHYARKYNMLSVLGDVLDHVRDWIMAGVTTVLMVTHPSIPTTSKLALAPIGALGLLTGLLYTGAVEIYAVRKSTPSLSIVRRITYAFGIRTKEDATKWLHRVLRWSGTGVSCIVFACMFLIID